MALLLLFAAAAAADICLKMTNMGSERMDFLCCNTTNKLVSDVSPVLFPGAMQIFNFETYIDHPLASGDCTYRYGKHECLVNFQWYHNEAGYYYGITDCQDFGTRVKIENDYSARFVVYNLFFAKKIKK